MASHTCIFCGVAMDSRDGHRECPGCLGRAHLLSDVKNPCPDALDLPLEERARRAGLQTACGSPTDSSSTQGGQSCEPEGKSLKRRHKTRAAEAFDPAMVPPGAPVQESVEEQSMYTHLLAVIRGLTDRVNSFGAHPQQADAHSAATSPGHLLSFQQDDSQELKHLDAISLYAQDSLVGVEHSGEPRV